MTTLTQLALLGTAEAAVILLRCKSAVEPGPFSSAFWTFMTCVLRVVFVQLGMTAMLDGLPMAFAVAAYAIPAAVATFAIHALDDQHERSRHKLNGPQAKLFDYVVARKGGEETGRTELADHTGYTESSGTFRNLLSEMKGLGLFRYPTKRTVAATDILFPDGLR